MLKLLFTFFIAIHGAIHLMGFAKAFNYAEIKEITGAISRPAGAIWLSCAILLAAVSIMFVTDNKLWWAGAIPAAVISQGLIISCFADAKFGTIPNIIILLAAAVAFGSWNFERDSMRAVEELAAASKPETPVITADKAATLPPSIKKWLERSGAIGKKLPPVIRLSQSGLLRTSPDGPWMPVTARQWLSAEKPGFVWIANIDAGYGIHISGCDRYLGGRGNMLIKVMSLLTVADSKGKQIDQGTLLRFLGESVWAPNALLSPHIKLEQAGPDAVSATMNYEGVEASGTYRFTPEGDFKSFEAKRFYDRKEGATLEDWLVTAEPDGYREFDGIRVAAKMSVTWKLKQGDFTWYKLNIDNIEYASK